MKNIHDIANDLHCRNLGKLHDMTSLWLAKKHLAPFLRPFDCRSCAAVKLSYFDQPRILQ